MWARFHEALSTLIFLMLGCSRNCRGETMIPLRVSTVFVSKPLYVLYATKVCFFPSPSPCVTLKLLGELVTC